MLHEWLIPIQYILCTEAQKSNTNLLLSSHKIYHTYIELILEGNPKILCRRTLRQLFAFLRTLSLHRFHGLIIYNIDTKAKCRHLKRMSKYCSVGSPHTGVFHLPYRMFWSKDELRNSVPKCR